MSRSESSLLPATLWRQPVADNESVVGRSERWFICEQRDPFHPTLPTAGCGYSVITWADLFLRSYANGLFRRGRPDLAIQIGQVHQVFDTLEQSEGEDWRRRETEAYEFAVEHYDDLHNAGAPESLLQAFQLVMLLLMAINQLRKQYSGQGVLMSYASLEEALNVNGEIF
ncbi:hypothetical protein [Oceanobacter antarcticus]|uniref:Uncharacterized protein n=1 Tax=Oceanobacter antarcticus TaxID=3133425 RepID=A0ABW8NKA0_9GAMM